MDPNVQGQVAAVSARLTALEEQVAALAAHGAEDVAAQVALYEADLRERLATTQKQLQAQIAMLEAGLALAQEYGDVPGVIDKLAELLQ